MAYDIRDIFEYIIAETYAKSCDPATGLYFQSSQYVYSFLKAELATGKVATLTSGLNAPPLISPMTRLGSSNICEEPSYKPLRCFAAKRKAE